jgi:ankyrin repeat protein
LVKPPLHYAAQYGHKEIVQLLISKGANVKAKTDDGRTPLHSAAAKEHKDIAELLIEKGADVTLARSSYPNWSRAFISLNGLIICSML